MKLKQKLFDPLRTLLKDKYQKFYKCHKHVFFKKQRGGEQEKTGTVAFYKSNLVSLLYIHCTMYMLFIELDIRCLQYWYLNILTV